LLPRCRPDIRHSRIIATEDLPKWASTASTVRDARAVGIPGTAVAGRVRIAYLLEGREVHEEFTVMLANLQFLGAHYWGTEWATSVRAAPGQLASVRQIGLVMASSFRPDLRWFARHQQAADMVANVIRHEVDSALEVSRILARTNDHGMCSFAGAGSRCGARDRADPASGCRTPHGPAAIDA
jgi:hypothetical protein